MEDNKLNRIDDPINHLKLNSCSQKLKKSEAQFWLAPNWDISFWTAPYDIIKFAYAPQCFHPLYEIHFLPVPKNKTAQTQFQVDFNISCTFIAHFNSFMNPLEVA